MVVKSLEKKLLALGGCGSGRSVVGGWTLGHTCRYAGAWVRGCRDSLLWGYEWPFWSERADLIQSRDRDTANESSGQMALAG